MITLDQTLTPASELLQLEDEHVAHNTTRWTLW